MILDRSELEPMKIAELRNLMLTLGGSNEAGETKESLINRLILHGAKQGEDEKPEDGQPKVKTESSHQVTIEQLKKAVGRHILRGMKLFYNADEDTWLMRVRLRDQIVRDTNSGMAKAIQRWANDSGTMKMPIGVITMCAAKLMQNAPKPDEVAKEPDVTKGFEAVA